MNISGGATSALLEHTYYLVQDRPVILTYQGSWTTIPHINDDVMTQANVMHFFLCVRGTHLLPKHFQ